MILQPNSADILSDTLKKSAEIHASPKIAEINVIYPVSAKTLYFKGTIYILAGGEAAMVSNNQLAPRKFRLLFYDRHICRLP
jgi:hypothetical protein